MLKMSILTHVEVVLFLTLLQTKLEKEPRITQVNLRSLSTLAVR